MALFDTMADRKKEMGDLPSIRSYRLRGARMTGAQSQSLSKNWQKYGIELTHTIHPHEMFPDAEGAMKEVVLEIGSGMGEATSMMASQAPDSGFIAIEVHTPGIGALIIRAEELKLDNLRIIEGDATVVIRDFFDDGAVDVFHIFFPDPWPKTRQRKRRLIQKEFINLLALKLKPAGRVHLATDWIEYARAIERDFTEHADFDGGVAARPKWRPLTKFESQGIDKEHEVTDFLYIKNN